MMESPGRPEVWEVALAAFLAVVLTAALVLMLTAGLAGTFFGDGWASGALADMPAVAQRLPRHLDDPRNAWPSKEAARLPGPAGIYCAFALVLAALLCGVVAAHRVHRRLTGRYGARWAGPRDLSVVRVREARRGRITVGTHGRRLIAAEAGQSVLTIAPTQSGKTTALAVPNILEWDGPVIALSVKTDLLLDTAARRSGLGQVAVFDPTGGTGLEETSSWTPLFSCSTWSGARRVARWLTDGAVPNKRGLADGDFWYSAAAKLLAPLMFAASTSGLTMDEVVRWIDTQEESVVVACLEATGSDEAMNAMQANWARDDRQRSSVYTTAETVLEAYADPGVLARSRVPEIQPDWLLNGKPNTLYICASAREQRRLRPVFVALLEEMLEAAYARSSRQGRPLDPPLLLVLDEVANIAPLPDLDVIVSTGASHGVQLLTILQDLAQAYDRWGRERADTIVNNHRAKLLGAGLADERSLEWVGRLLGDQALLQHSSTAGEAGRRSTTESTHYRPLAPANVMREARAGSALLVYGNLRPAWVHLRPWYADRHLRALASGPHLETRR
jgi:type IV secretion system protein VirD4